MGKKFLVLSIVLMLLGSFLVTQNVEGSALPPVTVRRTVMLILIHLGKAQEGFSVDYSEYPTQETPIIDDRTLYLLVTPKVFQIPLNNVVNEVDAGTVFLNIKRILSLTQSYLAENKLDTYFDNGKKAIIERLNGMADVQKLGESMKVTQAVVSEGFFEIYLLWPDPDNIRPHMGKIVARAVELEKDKEIQQYIGVDKKPWDVKTISSLAYLAGLSVLLESFEPWQLKGQGNIAYYDQWKAYAAATGKSGAIEFVKELTRLNLALETLVEAYLGGVKIDLADPYQAGLVTTWSQRVFQLLHAMNYNPATERYERKIDFSTARLAVEGMLKAGPGPDGIRKALEDAWRIRILSPMDDRQREPLDKWAGLIQSYVAGGLSVEYAKANVLSIIKEGKVGGELKDGKLTGGIDLRTEVGRLYTTLYGGTFDPASAAGNAIYFGWATNIASVLHQYNLFGNKEKDLAQAATSTIAVMNNVIAENKRLFNMVNDYLLRGLANLRFEEGWMAGVGTYWGMIFTALKNKKGPAEAYRAVAEELSIRKEIWDAVRDKAGMVDFQGIVDSMFQEKGGYWLSVMNSFERLLDYSKGKTSRDQSKATILENIKGLRYDAEHAQKFTNVSRVLTNINPGGKLPMSLDEYLAGGGPYMSLGQEPFDESIPIVPAVEPGVPSILNGTGFAW
jgi:hypothetical protein